MPKLQSVEKVIGLDFGKRRIGVATGNTITQTASPLETISYQHPRLPWPRLDEIMQHWRPDLLILGMPQAEDDKQKTIEKPIRQFADALRKRYDIPLTFTNEAFSSYEASQRLKLQRQTGRKKKVNKSEIDAQAAAIIVEHWFEPHPGPLDSS